MIQIISSMKGFAQFYEKINVEFLNISEKYVLNKKRSPFGLCLKNGDAYGIRTRECMRERHVS